MNTFNPRFQDHIESSPRIDDMIRKLARGIEFGLTRDEALSDLISRGWDPVEAMHVFVAAEILAG